MEALAEAGTSLKAQDLALSLGLDRAVIYRLLRTLSAHNLVTPAGDGGYILGVGLLALSRGVQRHLREIALPQLLALSQLANATAFVGVREGDEVVCVAAVQPTNTLLAVRVREGLRTPMSKGASALAIRSGLPVRSDDAPEVVEARRLGYATSAGTLELAATAVSSSLTIPGGAGQACVTAIFPSSDLTDLDGIGALVLKTAAAISAGARRG